MSATLVRELLGLPGFSFRVPSQVIEGRRYPDRDGQSRCLNGQVRVQLDAGKPVISVDAKKKEPIGEYAHGSEEYQRTGHPTRALVHGLPDSEVPKAGALRRV